MGFYSIIAFFQKGGMFMYPILLVFALGMAIAIERWIQLNRVHVANQKSWKVLNTTAFGLMSAIPLLLFHAKLTSTTGQIVDSLEMAMVKAVNCISDFNRRHFEKESESPDEGHQVSNPESGPEKELVKNGHINDPVTSKQRKK